MSLIVSIDPGFSGAIGGYSPVDKRLVCLMPMPTRLEHGAGLSLGSLSYKTAPAKSRKVIDGRALAAAIYNLKPALVVVEKVTSSPQMGVTSAFRFGEGFGVIIGVIETLGLNARFVYPSAWKIGLGLSSVKTESRELACKLFPEWYSTFTAEKSSCDLAEAALLAYYGLRLQPDPNTFIS